MTFRRREKPRTLFDEPAPPEMATHCVRCEARLEQLARKWDSVEKGWLCNRCAGVEA